MMALPMGVELPVSLRPPAILPPRSRRRVAGTSISIVGEGRGSDSQWERDGVVRLEAGWLRGRAAEIAGSDAAAAEDDDQAAGVDAEDDEEDRRSRSRDSRCRLDSLSLRFGVSCVMASTGSIEEAWFDTFSVVESDEEDFQSVQDAYSNFHALPLSSKGNLAVITSPSSSKDDNLGVVNPNASSISSFDQKQNGRKLRDQDSLNLENTVKASVSHEDVSAISADENAGQGDEGILNSCGILQNNCLPCLVLTTSTVEKRKVLSSSPPNLAKKASLKLSFKWKSGEAHATSTLSSRKAFLEKPLAGSQVPFCLLEKKMLDSWSHIEPSVFRVRGGHYFR
ncbi:hypothetical protein GW17_00030416 [Ensete ventricosum]|nr:hypothetical protein GW17_00030416 [Ensete ventricosum]RZS17175.1 hypothetical protein BHM03_00049283 [Ensete ventricosum]